MIWLTLAILCYVLFALNAIGDKFLLSGTSLRNPATYAIFIGLAGGLVIVGLPVLGLPISNSPDVLVLSLASGFALIFGLLPFFVGLKKFQATSIVPTAGAMQPIFALLIGALLFSDAIPLSISFFVVLLLLILGGIFVSIDGHKHISIEAFCLGLLAGFFFALSFVLVKQVYLYESFWYGLFWSRVGGVFAAVLLFVCSNKVRREIFSKSSPANNSKNLSSIGVGALFLATQAIGALAGILQQAAIYKAPVFGVAIVNALQGTQYVFIFIITFFAASKFPRVFKERYEGRETTYKVSGMLMIIAGIIIFVYGI